MALFSGVKKQIQALGTQIQGQPAGGLQPPGGRRDNPFLSNQFAAGGGLPGVGGPPPPNSLGLDTAPVNTPVRPPGPTQQFGPDSNLISTQFNPDPSDRLQGAQDEADAARNAIAGFQPGQFEGIGAGTFGSGADTAAARAGITQDLGALRGGPSRGELASQAFEQIQERGRPGFERELRDVGRRAASLGRIGAGQTTSELNDVFVTRQRDLDLTRRGLATQSAGQEIGDRFNTLGASRGVAGQLFGQDIGQAGFQQGLRGEQRGERFAGQDFDFRNLAAQQGIAGQLAGFEGQQFGQEQSQRNELRGERGFQTALDQQNIQNRVQQRQLEEALLSGQFGRNLSREQLLAQLGFGGNSQANFGNASGNFANSFSNQANASNQAAAGLFGAFPGGQQQLPSATQIAGQPNVVPIGNQRPIEPRVPNFNNIPRI